MPPLLKSARGRILKKSWVLFSKKWIILWLRCWTNCKLHIPCLLVWSIELLNQWTIDSKMKLNYLKSTVMWFRVSKRNQRPCPPIMLGGIVLKAVTKQKYLGLVFDESLSWDHHVSLLCKRMSYYLYVIRCHRNVLGCKLLKLLTESLVLSHLNYCLPVWGVSLHT